MIVHHKEDPLERKDIVALLVKSPFGVPTCHNGVLGFGMQPVSHFLAVCPWLNVFSSLTSDSLPVKMAVKLFKVILLD